MFIGTVTSSSQEHCLSQSQYSMHDPIIEDAYLPPPSNYFYYY